MQRSCPSPCHCHHRHRRHSLRSDGSSSPIGQDDNDDEQMGEEYKDKEGTTMVPKAMKKRKAQMVISDEEGERNNVSTSPR